MDGMKQGQFSLSQLLLAMLLICVACGVVRSGLVPMVGPVAVLFWLRTWDRPHPLLPFAVALSVVWLLITMAFVFLPHVR